MRQLRRCMLVVLCVCVMGALIGCGNDNADNKATDYNGDRTWSSYNKDKLENSSKYKGLH